MIDRIDVSIEATYEHTKNAVVALEKANEAASSAFADKMIKALVITILVLAVLLGAKYAR